MSTFWYMISSVSTIHIKSDEEFQEARSNGDGGGWAQYWTEIQAESERALAKQFIASGRAKYWGAEQGY